MHEREKETMKAGKKSTEAKRPAVKATENPN
jgi:hypothetical protein